MSEPFTDAVRQTVEHAREQLTVRLGIGAVLLMFLSLIGSCTYSDMLEQPTKDEWQKVIAADPTHAIELACAFRVIKGYPSNEQINSVLMTQICAARK